MKKLLEVLWLIVTFPFLIFEEIAKYCRTERVLMITDHPAGQAVADRLQYKIGFVATLFTDFSTAIVHLRTMTDICLNQSIATASQQAAFQMENQSQTSIMRPTDLVVIDYGYSDRNSLPGLKLLLEALMECRYSGCILIRDWQDGKFKCHKCGDSCESELLEMLNITLPLDGPYLAKLAHVDDTTICAGQYPAIR